MTGPSGSGSEYLGQRREKPTQRTEVDLEEMATRVGYQHPREEPDRSGAGMSGTETRTQAGGKVKTKEDGLFYSPTGARVRRHVRCLGGGAIMTQAYGISFPSAKVCFC
jgi:hypothetical protein